MKPIVLIVILVTLFAVGIGGGFFLLTRSESPATPTASEATPTAPEATLVDGGDGHGKSVVIPANAKMCEKHRIPEVRCPFCTPSLIEDLGFCRGHDVAEALCSRCSPVLIAAFKAEGDWCEEHGLPESQCRVCNPPTES